MDIFKNIKEFFIPPEEDGDDYEERPSRREREPEHRSSREYGSDRFEDPTEKRNKVVNIQATAQLQVVLVKPEVFTDAKQAGMRSINVGIHGKNVRIRGDGYDIYHDHSGCLRRGGADPAGREKSPA